MANETGDMKLLGNFRKFIDRVKNEPKQTFEFRVGSGRDGSPVCCRDGDGAGIDDAPGDKQVGGQRSRDAVRQSQAADDSSAQSGEGLGGAGERDWRFE